MPARKPRKAHTSITALTKIRGNYGVGIEWDDSHGIHAGTTDLDLQAVIVNKEGVIVDTVFYNNLSAMNGSITHTGDATDGTSDGVDESVWIQLALVPEQVWGIIFVVCAFSKGSRLKDVKNGRVVLMEGTCLNRLQSFRIEDSVANADVVGLVKRTREGGWAFKEIDEPAEFGSHFVDIIEPCIGDVIRAELPGAPAFQKISFVTDKDHSVASLPADAVLKRIFVGIGGSLSPTQVGEVDIDVAAVFCNSEGQVIGAVDGDNHSLYGVEHSGDSVADDGMNGDDEAITIDLANVPDKVARIFIVLTVANGTFELVEHAYARVLDQHSSELVRFDIEASSAYRGLLVVQLFRSEGAEKRWGFQGLGRFFTCPGDWKSMANEITRVAADTEVAVDPAAVRQFNKTKSTKSHRSVEGAAAAPPGGQASDGEAQKAAATECMACGGAGCSMCRPTPTVREETLQPSSSSPIASRATGARLAIPGSFLSSTTGSQFFESNRASTEFASQRLGHGRLRLGRSTSNLKPNSLEQGGHMIVTTTPPTADRLMTDDSDVILVRPPDETDGERPRACRCFCGGT